MSAAFAKNQPIVRDRPGDRTPPADLRGARRERQHAADDRPDDPTRARSSPRATPTSWRCATCATRADSVIRAPAWFEKLRDGKRLPVQRALAAGALREDLQGAEARGDRAATEPVRGVELHGRLDEEPHRRGCSSIRNNAFAQLGDTNLADGEVQGRRAELHGHRATPSLTSQLARRPGHVPGAVLPDTCGASATTGFHYSSSKPDALPTQIPGNVATAPVRVHRPELGHADQPGAHLALRPRPARLAQRGHRLMGAGAGHRATTWSSAPPTGGGWPRATPSLDASAIVEPQPVPDRRRPPPAGRAQLPLPRPADGQPAGLRGQPCVPVRRPARSSTPSNLFYDGNSQGGIEGGLTTAVSPDIRRAVLGVTGDRLRQHAVQRSTDFAPFKAASRRGLPGRVAVPGDPRPDPAAVGSRRPGRLRRSR